MKINSSQFNTVSAIDNKSVAKNSTTQATAATRKAQRPGAIDPVLGEAQAQLATMPEIDMDRVAEMKQAISNGQIGINVDELTVAMQKYYQG